MDFDFGYNGEGNATDSNLPNGNGEGDAATNLDNNGIQHNPNGEPADDLDGKTGPSDDTTGTGETNTKSSDNTGNDDSKNTVNELEVGTSIEVGDETYTVDESGNLVDKNNQIFKKAEEVKAWLESFDKVEDNNNELSINTIQDTVGIQVTDENDKPIEFENSPAGVKAYIDAVVETKRNEHYETAINTLYQRYPILNDVLNYYIANGNSLEGFGQMPDRSNITIDDSNEAQQEYIIKTAWTEQNRKGDVNGYIQYLKSAGILAATAKEELAGLQESDRQQREVLEKEAERIERENIENLQKYWNGVNDVIKSRKIAGYEIPESIIITRDGQKLAVTPNDFFNYLYRTDSEGRSAYERDLAKETPESRRDDEILRAYLKFVGGNYSNLVDMAINKEKVATLKLKAKERNTSTIKINRPKQTNSNKEIDFGF